MRLRQALTHLGIPDMDHLVIRARHDAFAIRREHCLTKPPLDDLQEAASSSRLFQHSICRRSCPRSLTRHVCHWARTRLAVCDLVKKKWHCPVVYLSTEQSQCISNMVAGTSMRGVIFLV